MTFLALISALVVGAGSGPSAQTPESDVGAVLQQAGLIGSWAQDCGRPEAPDNWRNTVTQGDDGVVRDISRNGRVTFAYVITDVRRIDARDTFMVLESTDGKSTLQVVERREGDVHFAWSSIDQDGAKLVVDGRYPDNNEPSFRLTRCPF